MSLTLPSSPLSRVETVGTGTRRGLMTLFSLVPRRNRALVKLAEEEISGTHNCTCGTFQLCRCRKVSSNYNHLSRSCRPWAEGLVAKQRIFGNDVLMMFALGCVSPEAGLLLSSEL